MGCHILYDRDNQSAVLFCSTSEWAFGPVFCDDGDHDADERAEAFLAWMRTTTLWPLYEHVPLIAAGGRDPRNLTENGLAHAYADWRAQETAQWATVEAEMFDDEPAPRRRLTREERLEGLADRGIDTHDEYDALFGTDDGL